MCLLCIRISNKLNKTFIIDGVTCTHVHVGVERPLVWDGVEDEVRISWKQHVPYSA